MKKESIKGNRGKNIAGFSLIELLIVIVIIGILATISSIYVISSRRSANGASAVASLRVFTSAQTTYAAGAGNKDYGDCDSLFKQELIDPALAGGCTSGITSTSIGGIPPPTSKAKSGFLFQVTAAPPGGTVPSFTVNGFPQNSSGVARDGDRTYYVDQTGVIRVSNDPTVLADVNSPPVQ